MTPMKTEPIYVISYFDNYGNTELVGVTNDPENWIKQHNETREDKDKNELSDFELVETVNFINK